MQFLMWVKSHIVLLLAIILSIYLGRTLLTPDHFHTHDDIQVFRTNEFQACIQDGQIPCRWSKQLGKGYGYPLFIFYPPMIYILPSLISYVGNIPISFALNLAAFLTFPLAAIGMYRLLLVITNRKEIAGIASALYLLLPYHAVNVFVRGVYGENLVWAITPFLFAEVYLVITKNKSSLVLTILLAMVLLTHNISAMILFSLLGVWGLSIIASKWVKYKERLLTCILAGILALALSSFYLIPALIEKQLVQTESMISGYYSFIVHFPSLKQLFFSNYWGYGGSNWGNDADGLSFAIGQVQWIGLLVVGIAVLMTQWGKSFSFWKNPIIISISSCILVLLFLTNPRSTPIWNLIPQLQYIQFPWRLVGPIGILIVILGSYLLSLIRHKIGIIIGLLAVAIAISLYGNYFRPEKFDGLTDQDFVVGREKTLQMEDHLFDYLPKTVKVVPDFAKGIIATSTIPLDITTYTWNSNTLDFVITENKAPQNIAVSIFYYPGWSLKLNAQSQNISPDPVSGLITFDIPEGDSHVTLRLQETPLRQVSNCISIVSFIILVITIALKIRHKRK